MVSWDGCGGSVIHDDLVLSAAHCDGDGAASRVVIGPYNLCEDFCSGPDSSSFVRLKKKSLGAKSLQSDGAKSAKSEGAKSAKSEGAKSPKSDGAMLPNSDGGTSTNSDGAMFGESNDVGDGALLSLLVGAGAVVGTGTGVGGQLVGRFTLDKAQIC